MSTSEPLVSVACRAMATRFEIAMWGGSAQHLEAAGEEALEEVRRLEAQLSLYRDDSEVFELNVLAAREPVTVTPQVFRLLQHAKALNAETEGAFDITIAPLMRAWGFIGGSGHMAEEAEVSAARELTGMDLIELDERNFTVRFLREGVTIDLGAIGKGYAIDQAADILREAGIGGALIHGGTSTVQAVGAQADGSAWPIAIQDPTNPAQRLATVPLLDNALSVSAVHGKSFTEGDVRYGHVLDPRSGHPVQGALLSAVLCDSATDSDALSTALLVLGDCYLSTLTANRPTAGALVVTTGDDGAVQAHSVRL